jgi:hypothetical protein
MHGLARTMKPVLFYVKGAVVTCHPGFDLADKWEDPGSAHPCQHARSCKIACEPHRSGSTSGSQSDALQSSTNAIVEC